MAISIRDVAKKINLSITTVSRALDGYDDVSEETRNKVLRTAAEMGYIPNRAARQLRRKRTDTIGYILPAYSPRFADPFYSEFIIGIADGTSSEGFDLLVSTAGPSELLEKETYQKWLQGRKVDGFIINRVRSFDWRIQFLCQNHFPFISLGKSLDPFDYSYVEIDNQGSFKQLTQHLIDLGHRRIAYIGGPSELMIEVERHAGYLEALRQADVESDPKIIAQGDLSQTSGYQTALDFLSLSMPPTAISCINDRTAIGAIHAAHERRLTVGKDVAIAGFDGIEESSHTLPPLTTINQPVYQIARQMIGILLSVINNETGSNQVVKFETELIERASTIGEDKN
jgi:LacI family transcriptional regulator